MRTSRNPKFVSLFLALTLLANLAPGFVGASFDQPQSLNFLKASGVDEWGVMALSSANSLNGVGLDFLKTDLGNVATDIEKRILAIVAAGQDPEAFGAANLVQKLTSHYNGAEIDAPAGLLNDDIFGLLAFDAVGTSSEVRNQLAATIKQNQNSDGGWSYLKTPSASDSNDTAMALMALLANRESPSAPAISHGFGYLAATQTQGGYSFDAASGFGPDAASTAWAISAQIAGGRSVPQSAISFLQSLQRTDGSFSWQPGGTGSALMTAYAVIALNNSGYPIHGPGQSGGNTTGSGNPGDSGSGQGNNGSTGTVNSLQFQVSIVGPDRTIFQNPLSFDSVSFVDSGGQPQTINQPVALGTITVAAAHPPGFSFVIRNTSLGFFVDSIAGIAPAGNRGWMYAVNGVKPSIGAGQYVLKNNDQVIWFYGSPNDPVPVSGLSGSVSSQVNLSVDIGNAPAAAPPTVSLQVSSNQIRLGQPVQLTWSSQNATLLVNATPDNWASGQLSGQVTLQPAGTTVYSLAVQGPGGIAQQSVTVNVDATPSVVFGVDVASIDFGKLLPGQESTVQILNLTNQGQTSLAISTSLQDTNVVYQQGLYLDNDLWSNYHSSLAANSKNSVFLQLRVPANYQGAGRKGAVLIFWAHPR